MVKTDWRSEGEPIWWKPYCKKYGAPMNGEIEICGFFDEILKQQIKAAKIEVLEKVIATGDGYLEKTHYGCVCELADIKE